MQPALTQGNPSFNQRTLYSAHTHTHTHTHTQGRGGFVADWQTRRLEDSMKKLC